MAARDAVSAADGRAGRGGGPRVARKQGCGFESRRARRERKDPKEFLDKAPWGLVHVFNYAYTYPFFGHFPRYAGPFASRRRGTKNVLT